MSSRLSRLVALAAVALPSLAAAQSPSTDTTVFAALKWREIGPGEEPVVSGPAELPVQARRAGKRAERRGGRRRCSAHGPGHAVFGMFAPQMQKQLLDYRKAVRDDLAKVNAALRAAGVREIVPRNVVM